MVHGATQCLLRLVGQVLQTASVRQSDCGSRLLRVVEVFESSQDTLSRVSGRRQSAVRVGNPLCHSCTGACLLKISTVVNLFVGSWSISKFCLFSCFSCLLTAVSLPRSGVHFGLLTGAVEHRGPRARRCVQACLGPWHAGHCLPLLIFGVDSTQNSGCAAGFCGLGLRSPSLLEPRDEHDLPNLFVDCKGPSRH